MTANMTANMTAIRAAGPMRYISTRGRAPAKTFSEILLEGLAPDGGLYLPEHYPRIDKTELAVWRGLSYPELAVKVLGYFIDDIPADDLATLVRRTYTPETYCHVRPGDDPADIVPLRWLNEESGLALLQLSNGPTLAFKDMAMQLLGNLFEYTLAKSGRELNILGATSGDTGSAAEYALAGKKGIRVFMLSPLGKMTRFQTAQMYSLADPNIFNIAVRGVFDDCQDIVKNVSNDLAFKERHRIGTVNSINWSRVAAQIVYYFKGYFAATRSNDEEVSFSVPSGNFGNICAGHIARMMGLPIRQLILATNENDVLDEFFNSGVYRPRATNETLHTSSPSMDISKASNFERFVFDLVGRDAATVRELWAKVDAGGAFDLSQSPHFARVKEYGMVAGASSHQQRLETIRKIWQDHGVMLDTHTADGVNVGLRLRDPRVPLICLETALPAKFEDAIVEALGRSPERPAGLEGLEELEQHYVTLDAQTDAIKHYLESHCHD
jgi:threonine synthase